MELLKNALKNFDGKVIISMGMFGNDLDEKSGSVQVKGWLENRFELLKAADLTIARPGLATIGDFLRFGVPSILVPTLNHPEQYYNAQSVERLNVGRLLEQNNLHEKSITDLINEILNNNTIKKSSLKMQNVMKKYNGMKKVRSIIREKISI